MHICLLISIRYPQSAKSQIHRTKAALPSDIIKALAGDPHLIQKAVECFYTRDALQLRVSPPMILVPRVITDNIPGYPKNDPICTFIVLGCHRAPHKNCLCAADGTTLQRSSGIPTAVEPDYRRSTVVGQWRENSALWSAF